MTAKKTAPKKTAPKKANSTIIKIAETIGTVAGEISVKKDQITDMASNAIKSVKSKIHEATAPDIKVAKKAVKNVDPQKAIKVVKKKVDKKVVKPLAKEANAAKKAVEKTTHKVVKTATSAKKAAIKAAKKPGSKK